MTRVMSRRALANALGQRRTASSTQNKRLPSGWPRGRDARMAPPAEMLSSRAASCGGDDVKTSAASEKKCVATFTSVAYAHNDARRIGSPLRRGAGTPDRRPPPAAPWSALLSPRSLRASRSAKPWRRAGDSRRGRVLGQRLNTAVEHGGGLSSWAQRRTTLLSRGEASLGRAPRSLVLGLDAPLLELGEPLLHCTDGFRGVTSPLPELAGDAQRRA